jgi:aerobic-type carbon monoxide dehydrogenase small subunit (CoxS/CutS family)
VNDCQIGSCDHYLVRLNSEAVSADVVVIVVAMDATETENAEMAVRMGAD